MVEKSARHSRGQENVSLLHISALIAQMNDFRFPTSQGELIRTARADATQRALGSQPFLAGLSGRHADSVTLPFALENAT
jgi:hypothetical protein